MSDPFQTLRSSMVSEQLIPRGVRDERILQAMEEVPRHLFVPEDLQRHAYEDGPLPIGKDQTISQPYIVANMTELAQVMPEDKVLEIGTGCGYQAAVLSRLCKAVYTVERIASLSETAKQNLTKCGYDNLHLLVEDGTKGWPEHAPYDAILVTAAASETPEALFEQLAEGGTLVIPVGGRFSQTMRRIKKINGKIETEDFYSCRFVPLVGACDES